MARAALLALGLALIAEGLAWAFAPRLIEDLLDALRSLSLPQRRLAGLAAITIGLLLVAAARATGTFLTPS